MKKLEVYEEVVETLQINDHNGTYDEILQDMDNNLDYALELLALSLKRTIIDDDLEGEELQFYVNQLEKINSVLGGNYHD